MPELPMPPAEDKPPETEAEAKARVHRELLEQAAEQAGAADALIVIMAKGRQQILLHTPIARQLLTHMLEDAKLTLHGIPRVAEVERMVEAAIAKALARQRILGPGGKPLNS